VTSDFNPDILINPVAKALNLCYANPEKILQCGDDSIFGANFTRHMGLPCLGEVGASVRGLALLAVGFSVLVSMLRSPSMSGAALSLWLMGVLHFRGSCS